MRIRFRLFNDAQVRGWISGDANRERTREAFDVVREQSPTLVVRRLRMKAQEFLQRFRGALALEEVNRGDAKISGAQLIER